MSNFKAVLKSSLVIATFVLGAVAFAAAPIEKKELTGHVFSAVDTSSDDTVLKIQANGSWKMSGALVRSSLHTASINGKDFTLASQTVSGKTQQILELREDVGGIVTRLSDKEKAEIKKSMGKDVNFVLVFANAEGSEILIAE
jgi:hypothetical protein